MSALKLYLLGPPRVELAGAPVDLQRRKALALLIYLAVSGQPHSRDALATLFWPDHSQSQARAYLRRDLAVLNTSLAGEWLAADREIAELKRTAELWVDVAEFSRLLAACRSHDHPPEVVCTECLSLLTRAAFLYTGDFLAGFTLRDSPEFDDWQFFQAESLRQELASALDRLVHGLSSQGTPEVAIPHARRRLALDSLYEPAQRQLIQLYDQAGQPAAALRQYEEYVELLEEELGLPPEEETTTLYEAIKAKRILGSFIKAEEHKRDSQARQSNKPAPQSPAPHPEEVSSLLLRPPASRSTPPQKLTQQIRYCHTADGMRLAYAWVGQGPPLVKAANWLSHLEYDWQSPVWRHWLEGLAQHHTLIRYDERGCGLSDWQVDDFSFETWVDDLETVVEAAGLERFPLLGLSQGGPIAIAYAVRHPEKVSHLILYGSYVRGRLKRNLTAQQLEEAQTFIQLIKVGWGQENPAFRQVFTTLFMPDATLEQQRWFNDLQRISASPENAMRIVAGFNTIDVRNLAAQIKIPTLVLHAKGDARIPFDEGELITSLIPSARFVSLESKNHILLEHEPAWQQFLTEVHHFLGVEAATPTQPRSASEPSAILTHLAGDTSEPRLAPALTPAGPRFVQEKLIATGGMGQVYLGRDTATGQPVAIKRLKPELLAHHPEAVQRFLREGEILRQLNHPNIVKILALLEDKDQPMIVMEYVPDGSLKELLDQQTQLPLERTLNIGLELADALARVHHLDILHRDLKPANVLMAADGAPRLTDFGIAYLAQKESKLTQEGAILGTTAYLSPEAWRGEVLDARSDIWSFGAVLYEMLAGRPPFAAGQATAIMTAILNDPLPDLAQFRSDAPPALVTLIKHMLVKERELRLDSMRQVAAGLEVIYRDL